MAPFISQLLMVPHVDHAIQTKIKEEPQEKARRPFITFTQGAENTEGVEEDTGI